MGHSIEAIHDLEGFLRRRYDRHGPVSWGGGMGMTTLTVLGPDATEVFFQNRDKAFGNSEAWELMTGPFVQRGLLLLDFDEHLRHRRIMQEAFSRDRLNGYLDAMNPVIEQGLGRWEAGPRVKVTPSLKNLSLDIAGEIFLGEQLGDEKAGVDKAFQQMLRGAASVVRFPVPGGNWARGMQGRRTLEDFMRSRIASRRAGDGDDLFSALCHARSEEGETFSDDDVVNHMIFVLFAAHDTSTVTMSAMVHHLARHPQWQERAREESVALGKDGIGFDDLEKLPTLDLVMKESLRMVAPISVTFRNTVKDTEILGHHVPAGTLVTAFPQFSQNMPEFWPNPETFDPERFSEERREDKVHRFAWAPFGGGAHKCIGMHFAGMEVKAILHRMLLDFEWSADPAYAERFVFRPLPEPKHGVPVNLRRIR